MSKKSKSSNGDIIDADLKEYEVYEPNNYSLGRAIVSELGFEAGRAFIPIAIESIKQKLEHDQESQKLLRDDKRKILNNRAEKLISRIENEEDKPDFNQERIDHWCIKLEEVMNELDTMDTKTEGFTRGLLYTAREFINSKLK